MNAETTHDTAGHPGQVAGSFLTSQAVDKISPALARAYAEMDAATRNATNPHFRSEYADMNAVDREIRPKLAAEGLFVIQTLAHRAHGSTLVTRVMHESGQWIESEVLYVDPGSGATAQKHGSALTYARRYGLMTAVGLSVSDKSDDDGNAASERGAERAAGSSNGASDDAPRRIKAKFDGECSICHGEVLKHHDDNPSYIAYKPGTKKVAHWVCWERWQDGQRDFTPQAQPETQPDTKAAEAASEPDDDLPY